MSRSHTTILLAVSAAVAVLIAVRYAGRQPSETISGPAVPVATAHAPAALGDVVIGISTVQDITAVIPRDNTPPEERATVTAAEPPAEIPDKLLPPELRKLEPPPLPGQKEFLKEREELANELDSLLDKLKDTTPADRIAALDGWRANQAERLRVNREKALFYQLPSIDQFHEFQLRRR